VATRLERAPDDLVPGRELWLKREDEHDLGAFKWRAALPVVERFARRGAPAVVTASTGNHGVATAWACGRANVRAIVYAPEQASAAKVELLRGLAAEVRFVDGDLDDAKERARADAGLWGLPFFEDGAEPLQYEAYESIGDELAEQLPSPPAAVVVPVGNGALLGGIGRVLGQRSPATLRVGVVAKEAPVMKQSWEARRPVETNRCATFADGLAVRVAISLAVERLDETADRMLEVSERELAHAVAAYAGAGIRAEGAAAAALAALPQLDDVPDPLVLVVTGCNIDDELLRRAREEPESFSD
jgi:threonine dehydratase